MFDPEKREKLINMKLFKIYQVLDGTLLISYAVASNEIKARKDYHGIQRVELLSSDVNVINL